MPGLILGNWDQAGRVQEEGTGGGISREGPGQGPGPPNLTFSIIFEFGQAVVPLGFFFGQQQLARTFIFF